MELYFEQATIEKLPTYHLPDKDRFDAYLSDTDDFNVAIFGLEEGLNSFENSACAEAPNYIRRQLYALRGGFEHLKIRDFGNIRRGKTLKDSYIALRDIISELAEKGVVSIVLGGSHDLSLPIFEGLKKNLSKINISVIDSKIDLGCSNNDYSANSFLDKIVYDSNLHRIESIAHQSYFVPESHLFALRKRNQYGMRLGMVRDNIQRTEPLLRDSDFISFDASALRQSDMPCALANPNGLYAEEACHLARFGGLSDRVKVFGFFELNPQFDQNDRSTALAAQIIWHFIEGLSKRFGDYPVSDFNNYQKYVVMSEMLGENVVFYKNEINRRWWIEIPNKNNEMEIYACMKYEYEQAKRGKIPDIWLKYYKK